MPQIEAKNESAGGAMLKAGLGLFLLSVTLSVLTSPLSALTADDLAELVGYTIVAASTVEGDFEGADFDKRVGLDNGMVFEFAEYSYTYSYRPTAIVFARTLTPAEMRKLGLKNVPTRPITLYKLIVDDEAYDVRRVR